MTLRATLPGAIVTSARTGTGIDELLTAIEDRLPKPEVPVDVVIPYSRGDLVDRVHKEAVIQSLEHTEQGTHVVGLAKPDLADDLVNHGT